MSVVSKPLAATGISGILYYALYRQIKKWRATGVTGPNALATSLGIPAPLPLLFNSPFMTAGAIAAGMHGVGFLIAALRGEHRVHDPAGLSAAAVAGLYSLLAVPEGLPNDRQIVSTAMLGIWTIQLATSINERILVRADVKQLTKMLPGVVTALLLDRLKHAILISSPVVQVNAIPATAQPAEWDMDSVGRAVWVAGMLLSVFAESSDVQAYGDILAFLGITASAGAGFTDSSQAILPSVANLAVMRTGLGWKPWDDDGFFGILGLVA